MTDIRRPEQLLEKLEADRRKVTAVRDGLMPAFTKNAVRKLTEFAQTERGGPRLLASEEVCLDIIDNELHRVWDELTQAMATVDKAIGACQALETSLKKGAARR